MNSTKGLRQIWLRHAEISIMKWAFADSENTSKELVLKLFGISKTHQRLMRFGLMPVDIVQVNMGQLFMQRPVRCEMIPVKDASTLSFLDDYCTDADGRLDYSICNSMQHKFMCAFVKNRQLEYPQTDYWQWHVNLRQAGINADVRSDQWIENKIGKLMRVFNSIDNDGYDYTQLSNFIWVMEKPLINTRYGYAYCPDGYEIFDGHHRAAAAACLGYPSLYALLVRDVATHSSFGIPLNEIIGSSEG